MRFCGTLLNGLLWLALLAVCVAPVYAQEPLEIAPHLGYGVHFGPNTKISPGLVGQLRMDWVKVYRLEDAYNFPRQRVLFRIDLPWPDDWNAFKRNLTSQIRAVAGAPIEAVEIHNEPNLSHEWGGRTPNGWQYTQMLRVAYTIVKSIKPGLIVVSGGLAPTQTTPDRGAVDDLEYAREMFENGAGQWFDAFGYHPYGYNMPPDADPFGPQPLVFRRVERIRALMEEYGIYKQIWLTEFGWLRDPAEDGVGCGDHDPAFRGFAWMRVSGRTQADYLERAFQIAHENWPWAGPMFVWNLNFNQMEWLQACDHMRWFGLLKGNGEPTAAFYRLAAMKHYVSDYRPKLELRAQTLRGEISLMCPRRVRLGAFTVENTGYPAALNLSVQPVNSGALPLLIEVEPTRARIGEPIEVYVNPLGGASPGQYWIFINIRTTINGRPFSQSLQGLVGVWPNARNC